MTPLLILPEFSLNGPFNGDFYIRQEEESGAGGPMELKAGFKYNPYRRPLLDIMQGKVGGDGPAAQPATELKTLGIQGLKKQLEAGETEKLTANGGGEDDEAENGKKKKKEEEEDDEGPVVVEEEYQDVVMAGPQGGLLSRQASKM